MAFLKRLWLTDFRNYESLEIEFDPGRIVLSGHNGQGKSNLLEAIAYLGLQHSFRGAATEALVRVDAAQAVIRATVMESDREQLVEIALVRSGPNKIQVNKQRRRTKELIGLVPTTVFGPDDLELVKGGPGIRRDYLDDVLVQSHPRNEQLRSQLEKILKQRNALLRAAGGRLTTDVETTLGVWNEKLITTGEAWGRARQDLTTALTPRVREAYGALAGAEQRVELRYEPPWLATGLAPVLAGALADELRRGVTLVGPHRDELELSLGGLPARTHASQGEQRTMSLALRIAGHHHLRSVRSTTPLLLLDDVFSELDPLRSRALLELLEAEQTVITTAAAAPPVDGEIQHFVIDRGNVSGA